MQLHNRLSVTLLFLLASAALLSAQSFQATVTGVVHDPTGAVVPGVQVTALDIANSTKYTSATNQDGIYRLPALPPAQYRVSAALRGFKTFEQGPITLQVNQILELNITLEPGQVSERVTVTAALPALETETASVGQVVTTRSILALPLNIRDPIALIGLTPGVTFGPNFGNGGGNDVGRNFFKSDFNAGGGRSGSQEILIDGAPDTTGDINRGIIDPPVDSVQEFKVQVNSYDAEFGRTSGGVLNIVTKSGSNGYHGTAYDFERHSVMDANNFFNNLNNRPAVSFARHQFGADLGGPIRKNKWFFFGDYEGLRQGYPNSTIDTVPTPLQLQGNFSQTFASNGQLIQLYDPATLAVAADGTRQRSPFPGNLIPASRFDPVAAKISSYYPAANLAGNAVGQNNYLFASKSVTNSDKYDLRTDVNIADNTRMFIRYSRQTDERVVPGNMPVPIGGGRTTNDHYTQGMADLTHVFSASTVLELQVSGSRALAIQYPLDLGFNLAALGFPASLVSQVPALFPITTVGDVTGTANTSDSFLQFQPRNVWTTGGTLNHLHGKHSLKFGGDFRILDFNEAQLNNASGNYSFGRTFTQGPNPVVSSATAGYGFASFLLGDAASGTIQTFSPISTRSFYGAVFAQDDWKVTERLTLNLGVRWDMSTGLMEKYNRLAYFNPTAPNSVGPPAGLPNLTGDLTWIGKGNGNQQASTLRDIGPRIGFAYRLGDNTVLRGGYGVFFLPRNVQGNGNGSVEAFRNTTMLATIDGVTPANTLTNPFPQGILPPVNDRNPLANVGSTIAAPEYSYRSPYAQLWSLGVQRELPGKMVLDLHYWGNKGTHLLETWNINQLPDQYLALGSHLNDQVPNPFYGVITSGTLTTPTVSRRQTLLPFPQYAGDSGVVQDFVTAGNSTYHAGTIQVERRLSSTLTFLSSYTRSKAIDDVHTPLDIYNRRLEKGLSTFDAPNIFVFSGVYQLPFGRDRGFGKDMNKFANAILGDWDLSGIERVQSGAPLNMTGTGIRPLVNNGQSAKLSNPSIYEWFNTSVFSNAAPFTFGNIGPVLPDVRSGGLVNLDAVLAKNFVASIRDRQITTQFRAEFYNVLNHPQFAAPNVTVSSQAFGQVTSTANNPRDIQLALKIIF
ncbi:MAG TPA: TonB-dependent receptor [Bryobacteraceae bacterium]|nr:TonB-dependent receptor [Bryobacteraceae bacterium]